MMLTLVLDAVQASADGTAIRDRLASDAAAGDFIETRKMVLVKYVMASIIQMETTKGGPVGTALFNRWRRVVIRRSFGMTGRCRWRGRRRGVFRGRL